MNISVSAVSFTETNPDLNQALFTSKASIDPAHLGVNSVLIAALGIPVNPSDCLQIKGSYKTPINFQHLGQDPNEPRVAVGGNEGCFKVLAVGKNVERYKVGQWVILKLTSFGTWRSHAIVDLTQENPDPLIVISDGNQKKISVDQASTISTNPCTAYQLYHQYISDWHAGDWIVVNAGTSFVNKYLFQITSHYGVNTLAVVRNNSDFADTVEELCTLGASKVISDEDFLKDDFVSDTLPKLVGSEARVRLALDSLGGPTTPTLVACLSANGIFVNYGVSTGQNVSFSPAVQLAKNITLKSYWLTRNTRENPQSKVDTVRALLEFFEAGVFKPVNFNHLNWDGQSDLTQLFLQAINAKSGKHVVMFPGHL